VIESAEARALSEDNVAAEGRLARARGKLALSYVDASGVRPPASSVELSVLLGSHADARVRRSAWDGLRSIESHVLASGFLELVALRNRLGRMLGGEDYSDWKVQRVERMSKAEVFGLLDDLEGRTRERGRAAVAELERTKGAEATRPWNLRWHVAGDVTAEQDPFFPFGEALGRWGRSFTALGIDYRGATLVLDLADRKGKYENGFMHGPVPAWRDRGTFRPARIHFTANAIPGMVGSGRRASETLFHEGGHAAHFANVDQPAPCFSQEFAPTSVAFSETQSMLLDSLLSDADWQARYARTKDGRAMPLALIEKGVRSSHPFAAWGLRAMVGVCQAEREIYELDEREATPERVLALVRDVERRHLFVEDGAPRPILSIPHLLAGDSSAYYHGYVLAEMAVWQTREHFVARDGHLLDNPRLGPDLRERYWRPGNAPSFGELVEDLVGAPPSAEALARHVARDHDTPLAEARADVRREPSLPRHDGPVALDATVRVVHGRETVAEVARGGAFEPAAEAFAAWVDAQAAARR
jgi:Zn-dependent oligopeptidase